MSDDVVPQFARVALPRPVHDLYHYEIPSGMKVGVGSLVEVSFGRSTETGIVVEITATAPDIAAKIKPIQKVYSPDFAIDPTMVKMCTWAARQFHAPVGELLRSCGPVKPDKELGTKKNFTGTVIEPSPIQLNAEQEIARSAMSQQFHAEKFSVHLLKGITGSGKTEVYLSLAREVLSAGKSVLVLVPEIALTSQLKDRFERGLGHEVLLWHSAVADGLRQNQWRWANEGKARVIVGARSAIFAPLKNIGLCILDEEHDSSFQQEERFRYHARELALFRAKADGFPVVLGSATPSLETWHRAKEQKIKKHVLTSRYANARLPEIQVLKIEPENQVKRIQSVLLNETLETIRATIARGEQVLVFLNRRGFSNFLMCRNCGWVKECQRCSVSVTHYKKKKLLHCHQCDSEYPVPSQCEDCGQGDLQAMGSGTESLTEDLEKLIPEAKVLRLDRDAVTSQKRLDEVLQGIRDGGANILVGTQMVVKGHDFPRVTLVVVPDADSLFHWPDFRAQERAIQSLIQVSGRSGRAELPGNVIVQAFDVENPALKVLKGDLSWEEWAEQEFELRRQLDYPPFSRLLRVRVRSREEKTAESLAEKLSDGFRNALKDAATNFEILGPSPALIQKVDDLYRYDLYVKSQSVGQLFGSMDWFEKTIKQWEIDGKIEIDPQQS